MSAVLTMKVSMVRRFKMGRRQLGKHKSHRNPLYGTWNSMRHRCNNPKNIAYPRYGALGVKVCDEWLESFDAFADWALANGWEQGLQIDKDIKSKELGIYPPIYSPETCSVVTPRVNNLNSTATKFSDDTIKDITRMFDSNEDTFAHRESICEKFNLTKKQLGCILARRAGKQLGRGRSGVLTTETKQKLLELRKQGLPFKEIANLLNINYNTCRSWHGKYMRENPNEL